MTITYKVKDNNLTINQILKSELHISSKLLHKLITNHLVTCNNVVIDTRTKINSGDVISIDFNYIEGNSNIIPTQMNLNIVYEDEWLIILNKPSGIPVHPSMLHYTDTLSNGLKFYFNKINLKKKIRPVNRLDMNTSGLILFAKNEYIQESLIYQMQNHIFKKEYIAIITGILDKKEDIIDKPIDRKPNSIIERCISDTGKKSITRYKVIEEFQNLSLVKCYLETGRTHQIRVHFASINHPLLGDTLYGTKSDLISGQALMCSKLSFIHPISQKQMSFDLNEKDLLTQINLI